MTPLERHCRRLAHAHPDPLRQEELLTTLLETNDGRRRPRPGDALNVLWHGVTARLGGTAAGTRFGVWGDAASIAVVLLLVMGAATAVAATTNAFARPPGPGAPYNVDAYDVHPLMWTRHEFLFRGRLDTAAAFVAAFVSAAAAVAACLGRVRLTRVLTAGAVAAAAALVWLSRVSGQHLSFRSRAGLAAAAVGLLLLGAVLGTGAVARAAAAVPSRWWLTAAYTSLVAALAVVHVGPHPFGFGRAAVLVSAYVVQAMALLTVAALAARRTPAVFGAAALLALPAVPCLPVLADGTRYGWETEKVLMAAVIGWALLPLVAWLVLRGRPTTGERPGPAAGQGSTTAGQGPTTA